MGLSLSLSPLVLLTTTTIQEFSSVCFMLYLTLCLLLSHYWPYINSLLFIIFKTTIFLLLYPTIFIIKGIFLNLPCKEKEKKFLLVQELSRTFLLMINILLSLPF